MTSLAESEVPVAAVGTGLAGAVPADLGAPAPPPGGRGRSGVAPPAVRDERIRSLDPQAARKFFADAYAPGWRLGGISGPCAVTHRRRRTQSVTVDEVLVHGRATLDLPAGETLVVIQPRGGTLTVADGPLPAADCPVLVANGMSCALQVSGARFDVVSVAPDALQKVAAAHCAPVSPQVQFLNRRPRSRAGIRAWHRALDYATATLASPDSAQQPLVVAGVAPLLASAMLECFPSTVTDPDLAGDPAIPETLRDAVSFIHRNAAGDVGINDIAAAVHLTPRAVQYLFRRRLDTTPTEYLRRVRLSRAHQELLAGTPPTTTVTQIAQRWGFAHTGRFAVQYRQAYGQSPHTTLRQ